ncbi:hypothetical protein C8R46DRAFT_1221833 [Mycena filopes]|nr:hypothetical protein C8R46DRAFT_1221833 [Mycena filopes]
MPAFGLMLRLADHEEPELPLPAYDPKAIPPTEELTNEEMVEKRQRVNFLDKRIRRWLKYHARRLRKVLRSKLDLRKDPWALFLAQLSGLKAPPKARQGYQQFMHEMYAEVIAPVAAESAAFRAKVARDMFADLDDSERQGYLQCAKEEAEEARQKFAAALKAPPSKSPAARQKCIDGVGNFLGPILQGIYERTGFHAVVVLGGPMPKYGGELRSVYVSYGRNRAATPQYIPEWAGERWDQQVSALIKEYLHPTFRPAPQDVADAALPEALLAGAKYTLDDHDPNPYSDDSSSSSEESSSDSNADSDDSAAPPKKRRKLSTITKNAAKATPAQGKSKAKGKARAAVADDSDEEEDADPFAGMGIDEIIRRTLTEKEVVIEMLAPPGLS